jgi:hypothetical protein
MDVYASLETPMESGGAMDRCGVANFNGDVRELVPGSATAAREDQSPG